MRKFVVEMRAKKPIVIIDAYYDGEGQALCPAATGITPPHQPVGRHRAVPDRAVHEGVDPRRPTDDRGRCARSSCSRRSCATSASWPQQTTRGCIVLERPDLLKQLVEKHGAKDATVRGTALAELEAMQVRTSQYNPGSEIPEKNWLYRLAKRFWFNDFGVYARARPHADGRPGGAGGSRNLILFSLDLARFAVITQLRGRSPTRPSECERIRMKS